MKFCSVLVTVLLLWPVASRTNDGPSASGALTYEFDLRAGLLSDSLRQLYAQSGFVASVWTDTGLDSVSTNAVQGAFTIDQAMTLLLADTGLAHKLTNERSVVVVRSDDASSSDRYRFEWPSQTLKQAVDALSAQTNTRVALDVPEAVARTRVPPLSATLTVAEAADYLVTSQSEQVRRTLGELRWQWRSKTIRFYNNAPAAVTRKTEASGPTTSEALIVTGSRIPLSTSRSLFDFSSFGRFDQRFIQSVDVESAGDILAYSPQQPYRRADASFQGEEYVELRGLGWNTTAVLINGKRTFPSKVTMNSVDISDIPAALVDHIDVLSDSGSAMYGGEAMGGVVNIVLKDHFDRPEVELEYGGADGGARLRRGSLGVSFSTERSITTMAVEAFDREMLLGSSRDLWRDQDYRRYGLSDFRSLASNPGTVSSLSGGNLPGLNASYAAIPSNFGSDHQLSTTDFVQTQGQRNYSSLSRYFAISPSRTRNAGFLSSKLRWSNSTTFSGELFCFDSTRDSQDEPVSLLGAIVPATNPYNPFGQDVAVDYLLSDAGPTRRSVDSELSRVALSAEHRIGQATWTTTALASHGESTSTTFRANAGRAMSALRATNFESALNPFLSIPNHDDLIKSLIDKFVDRQKSVGQQVSSVLEGPVTFFAGNVAQVKVGAEWRRESVLLDATSQTRQTADGARHVRSAFAEIELPFSLWPKGSSAGMTLSGRLDDYSDAGTVFNPRVAAMWQPWRRFSVHASYGESTRPASLFEMYTPEVIIPNARIADPRRGNQVTTVTYISGGNSDLTPFSSQSFTASALWSSREPSWQVMATYWNTRIEDRVSVATIFDLLNNETAFPTRVHRDNPSSTDLDAERPGRLISLDGTRINGGLIQTSGIDFQAQLERTASWAKYTFGLRASWTDEFEYSDLPGVLPLSAVNKARSVYGTIPRWRSTASVAVQTNNAELAVLTTWIPEYDDATPFGEPNGRRIGPRTLVDVHAAVNMNAITEGTFGEGTWLHLGAKNVFNRMPDPAAVGGPLGYDVTQFDLIGRQWFLKLSKQF